MKKVILSADGPKAVYEVPDKVADNLHKYCLDFCDWVYRSPTTKRISRIVCFDETDFIEYLNNVVYPNHSEKSRLIKELGYIDDIDELPEKYRKLPYFNF